MSDHDVEQMVRATLGARAGDVAEPNFDEPVPTWGWPQPPWQG